MRFSCRRNRSVLGRCCHWIYRSCICCFTVASSSSTVRANGTGCLSWLMPARGSRLPRTSRRGSVWPCLRGSVVNTCKSCVAVVLEARCKTSKPSRKMTTLAVADQACGRRASTSAAERSATLAAGRSLLTSMSRSGVPGRLNTCKRSRTSFIVASAPSPGTGPCRRYHVQPVCASREAKVSRATGSCRGQLEPRYERPDYRQRKAQGAAQGTEGLNELRAVGELLLDLVRLQGREILCGGEGLGNEGAQVEARKAQMLALVVGLPLQLVTKPDQDRGQIGGCPGNRKIDVGVGERCPALRGTQIVDERALTAATWSNEGQDGQQRPGLLGITAARLIKEGQRTAAVHEIIQSILHRPFPLLSQRTMLMLAAASGASLTSPPRAFSFPRHCAPSQLSPLQQQRVFLRPSTPRCEPRGGPCDLRAVPVTSGMKLGRHGRLCA